jgi:hypothetical protein
MFDDMRMDGNSLNTGLKYLLAMQSTVSRKQLSIRGSEYKNSNFSNASIMNH